MKKNFCQCGCNTEITHLTARGDPHLYVLGHNQRGRKWPKLKENSNRRTKHSYARRHKDQLEHCELEHIGHCSGPLDVAHIDGDFTNNDPSNWKTLCRSHHSLVDRGRINLSSPVMPPYRLGSGGKRRYVTT